jgi:hypothetical protein
LKTIKRRICDFDNTGGRLVHEPEFGSLIGRVAALERKNQELIAQLDRLKNQRRLKAARVLECLAVVLALMLAAGTATLEPILDQVRTRKLVVVDEKNCERVVISPQKDRAFGLTIADPDGKERFLLGVERDGTAGIQLRDDAGVRRLTLTVDGERVAGLAFHDSGERSRMSLGVTKDGAPVVALRDRNLKERLRVAVGADQVPLVSLTDDQQQERFRLLVPPAGFPWLSMYDKDHTERLSLAVEPDQAPAIVLRDKDGGARVGLAYTVEGKAQVGLYRKGEQFGAVLDISPDGFGRIRFYDANGNARLAVGNAEDGPFAAFAGRERSRLVLNSRGVGILDVRGTPRVLVGLEPGDRPSIELRDAARKRRLELTMTKEGTPKVDLADPSERTRTRIHSADVTAVPLEVLDENGKPVGK